MTSAQVPDKVSDQPIDGDDVDNDEAEDDGLTELQAAGMCHITPLLHPS
jgi:hypothetical protein